MNSLSVSYSLKLEDDNIDFVNEDLKSFLVKTNTNHGRNKSIRTFHV